MTRAEDVEKAWLMPPARTSDRREKGEGKLSLHAARRDRCPGPNGRPIPCGPSQDYREVKVGKKVEVRWRFTLRTVHGSKTYWADGWTEAERLSGGYEVELAKEAEREAKAATEAAEQEAKKIETRTVNDLGDHLIKVRSADNCSTRPSTVKGYERNLKRFIREDPLGALRVVEATPEHVDEWIVRHASAKVGKSETRAKRVKFVNTLFRLAVNDGWRGTNPVLKRHHVPVLKEGRANGKIAGDQRVAKPLSLDEVERIVAKLDPDDDALRLLVRVAARLGGRLREMTHARLEDFEEYDDGAVFLRVANARRCSCRDCSANGGIRFNKASEDRLAAVPPDLVDACRAHANTLRARFGPRAWFFPVWRAKPRQRARPGDIRDAYALSGTFSAAAKAAELPGRVFHDLRGSAKRWLLTKVEANPTAVDVMLGHRLPGMTHEYVNYRDNPVELYWDLFRKLRPQPALVKEAKTA